jgi:hypothetical protein
MPETNNGWDMYKKLVVKELERCNNRLDVMDRRLSKIERNIAVLQTKVYVSAAAVAFILSASVSILVKIL